MGRDLAALIETFPKTMLLSRILLQNKSPKGRLIDLDLVKDSIPSGAIYRTNTTQVMLLATSVAALLFRMFRFA